MNLHSLGFNKPADHLLRTGVICFLHNFGQFRIRFVASGCGLPERPDPLSNLVNRQRKFRVLPFEHNVQRVKLGPVTFQ
jgi:hypothetical protein